MGASQGPETGTGRARTPAATPTPGTASRASASGLTPHPLEHRRSKPPPPGDCQDRQPRFRGKKKSASTPKPLPTRGTRTEGQPVTARPTRPTAPATPGVLPPRARTADAHEPYCFRGHSPAGPSRRSFPPSLLTHRPGSDAHRGAPPPSTGPGRADRAAPGHRQDRTRNLNSTRHNSFLCYLLTCLRSKLGCLERNTGL